MENSKAQTTLKGIICFYSGSGNTRLACQYIRSRVKGVNFDLFDITKGGLPDFGLYDVVGFATFTDFLDPPYLVQTFIAKIDLQKEKVAFVFNTYGFVSGRTLRTLDKWVTARGFKVVAGHSLHMPESYSPMVAGGRSSEGAPGSKELARFDKFISGLEALLVSIKNGTEPGREKASPGLLSYVLPRYSRTRARQQMGKKYVDFALCNECGLCEKLCPYGALKLDPKPVFDMDKCYGCWRCYNRCPQKAIYTDKYRGVGHYPAPSDKLTAKLQ